MTYIYNLAERQQLMGLASYHERLKSLARQLCQTTCSQQRKRYRRQLLRLMEAAPRHLYWIPPQGQQDLLYLQASETAWDYIQRKLRGAVRGGHAYDPDAGNGSLITLWNIRCKGEYLKLKKQQSRWQTSNFSYSRNGERFNRLENQPAPPNPEPSLIQRIRRAIFKDVNGKFRSAWVHKASGLTAQMVCLHIVDSVLQGENWTLSSLAAHFQISPGSMNSAWTRTLKPLLQELGQELDSELD